MVVPFDTNDEDKFGLSRNIEISLFSRKAFQTDLFTFSILILLDIGLCTLKDDLTLSLGSLTKISGILHKTLSKKKKLHDSVPKDGIRRLHRPKGLVSFTTDVAVINVAYFYVAFFLEDSMTYLLFLGTSLLSLSLSFLLSFAFLEERLRDEDLVLGRNGTVISVYS
jgi:hypothetical protein